MSQVEATKRNPFSEGASNVPDSLKRALGDLVGDFETRLCQEAWGGLGKNEPLVSARAKILIALIVDLIHCGDVSFGTENKVSAFETNVDIAFQLGCSIEMIEEALKFGSVYAGFNKGASAFGRFMEIVSKGETMLGTKVPARDPNAFLPVYDGIVPDGINLSNNAVLADTALCAGLYSISPVFGESVVRWAGEVWGRPLLSQKIKAFVTVLIDVVNCHTVGAGNPWGAHINMCVLQGATVAEIEELLYFCCIYCGFNKGSVAFGAWKDIKEKGVTPFGIELVYGQQKMPIYAEVASSSKDTLEKLFPQDYLNTLKCESNFFADFSAAAVGCVWALPEIDVKTKCILCLAADVCNSSKTGPGSPFETHVQLALKNGCTLAEVEELFLLTSVYGGVSKATAAFGRLMELKESGICGPL